MSTHSYRSINPVLYPYSGGVTAIDSGFSRPDMAACYLLESAGEAAVIETGSKDSVPRIMAALAIRNIAPAAVRYVIVTHVHLDHAGGAGLLMAQLPNAEFLVHPRGARHMIDPAQLEASVRGVYGDAHFDQAYGTLQPIDESRVRTMEDGATVTLGQRPLLFRDTPGHARHHFCIFDEQTRGWFSGDTFGLSYRELDTGKGPFIFPTTTPIQFDPEAMHRSLDLLLAAQPRVMYLTHFGRVGDLERLGADLHRGVDELVAIALRHDDSETRKQDIHAAMLKHFMERARGHGVRLPDQALERLLAMDVELNTQGLEFWLDHGRQRK